MHLRISVLCFLLLCCRTGFGSVIISGKISGYDGKSIVYYQPTMEGLFAPYWKEIKPLGNGTFRIEFENEGYGNTRITYKSAYYRFFHDTNSAIYFEIREIERGKKKPVAGNKIFLKIDSLKQVMTVKISGDHEAINKFYNRNLRSSCFTTQMVDGNYYSELIYNSGTPSAAVTILDSLEQIEINQINQLPRAIGFENPGAELKDKEIRDFLIDEVHAFYSAVFLNGMFLKRKNQVIRMATDSASKPDLYNHDWELLIEGLNERAKTDLKAIPGSPDYLDFMESMAHALVSYKQYDFPQDPAMSLDDMVTNRLFKYDTTFFKDKQTRFAYELKGIHQYLNDQLFYSPALLHAIYDLQSRHPGSTHFDFYKVKIEKLRTSLEIAKQDFKSAKIVRSNYESFDDLLKRFAGAPILIDIWATWCHPCIEEFKQKTVLRPFIETGKIEMLYISIDKPQWEDRWRQSIKINELQGNHFRADKNFIADMWNAIGDSKGGIPRYVLVDKQGKIFISTAARPSEGNALVQQIELLLK